ncbi:MAG: hypothetical protein LBN93_11280 [Candidatus Symbiothrix sp.]|jgi:hypothetical protein|nr:hypothetical protein [Candidatus Symbiothrix sp.]
MKKAFLLITLMLACVVQMQAQFLLGSPGKTSLRSTTDQTAVKAVYGDMFVRTGNVVLNRTGVDDQSIQTALRTQNSLSIQLFDNVTVTAKKTGVRTESGGIYWTGTVPNGELTLFMHNGYLTGTLRQNAKVYDLTADANGNLRVVELNLSKGSANEDCYFSTEEAIEETFSSAGGGGTGYANIARSGHARRRK